MMRKAAWFAGAAALALAGVEAAAQERPPVRQEPIEIRGTVPTPQVVTVRPREVPAYSRRVLVPTFYDHDFWPSILPGYQVVPGRTLAGRVPLDTTLLGDTLGGMRIDTLARPIPPVIRDTTVRPDSVTPPAQQQSSAEPSPSPPPAVTPESEARRAPQVGTAPAPSTRQ
ncbi:MAG TPA: hypothetical protein VMM18_06075 [Gemmatimonadaceae bacterium]|nr:hypothetical protein [Gemmatimonadaceae bacterium]